MRLPWAPPFQLLPGLLLTQQLEEAQAMLERRNRRLTPVAWALPTVGNQPKNYPRVSIPRDEVGFLGLFLPVSYKLYNINYQKSL